MDVLFSKDRNEQSFLHYAILNGSVKAIAGILSSKVWDSSPAKRDLGRELSQIGDINGKRARDLCRHHSESELVGDLLDHLGSYPMDCYILKTRPEVLIFYCTEDRFGYAEEEKNWVKNYFEVRDYLCTVKRNPTGVDIEDAITHALNQIDLSGLIVFVMSHGLKGLVQVKGTPRYIPIQTIVQHMTGSEKEIPKVSPSQLSIFTI